MRSHAKVLVALAALCSFFALSAPAALAEFGHAGTFANGGSGQGGSGSDDGQLSDPGQADVNSTTGDFYVADTGNNRIQRFKPIGNTAAYDSQVSIAAPSGLAVDQASGAVYVSHSTGIAKFDSSLSPAAGWTDPAVTGALSLAVDPSSGDLLVADAGASLIRRFNSDGSADGTFAAERPVDVAATSSGQIIAITTTGDVISSCSAEGTVRRFSATGTPEGTIGTDLPAPAQLAVDSDDGSIVVAARNGEYNCGGKPPYLAFFAADGTAGMTIDLPTGSPVNASYGQVSGLAAQGGGSTRVYAVDKAPFDDGYGATAGLVYADLIPPAATIEVEVNGNEVELKGTVDPNGKATDYHFEYREEKAAGWEVTTTESAGSGPDPVPVSATVTLTPAAKYEARLIAQNLDGEVTAGPVGFRTEGLAPSIATLDPTEVTGDSARLRASINPGGAQTAYYFEYGLDTGYGSKIPLSPASIGAGIEAVAVSRLLTGLAPQTTYHYRVVATNSVDETRGPDRTFVTEPSQGACPNEAIRAQQNAIRLPECRAYEMVSPLSKGGLDVSGDAFNHYDLAAPDGSAILYSSPAAFAGAPGGALPGFYLGHRKANGWMTRSISPPQESGSKGGLGAGHTSILYRVDPGLNKAIFRTNAQLDPAATPGVDALYLRDLDSGSYELITPGLKEAMGGAERGSVFFRGASEDLEHVVVETDDRLTPDAPPTTTSKFNPYVFTDGVPELVSYLPGPGMGIPTNGEIGSRGGSAVASKREGGMRNAISSDGRYVYWATALRGNLYVRDMVDDVSTPVAAGKFVQFYGATPDGGFALYNPDAGAKSLCIYDRADNLNDCRQFDGDLNVLAVNENLTSIYVFHGNALLPEQSILRIELSERGDLSGAAVTEVATSVGPTTADLSSASAVYDTFRFVDTAAGGDYFAFTTEADVAGFENGGMSQAYFYDGLSDSLQCMSCTPAVIPGGVGAGLSETVYGSTAGGALQSQFAQPRAISADGSRVFFQTDQPLVSRDVNGVTDVYMWKEGEATLLSSGAGGVRAKFIDASESGDNVFIVTKARLSRHDTDDLSDLYNVRVGGGFPEPELAAPPCRGEDCQGPATSAPSAPAPASTAVRGRGNARSQGRRGCPKGKRSVKRKGKTRCVKKGKASKRRGKSAKHKRRNHTAPSIRRNG